VKLRFRLCFGSLTQPGTPLASNREVRKPCATLQLNFRHPYLASWFSPAWRNATESQVVFKGHCSRQEVTPPRNQ